MEILSKTGQRSLVLLAFILLTQLTFAQDNKVLVQAFSESYTLDKKGEHKKAVDVLKAVYDENSYELNVRLGWLTYSSGLFSESITYYQKAMTLKPYAIEPKLGYVYPASSLGNWDQVIKRYIEILTIDPQYTTANYRLGYIYYTREDYTNALKYFEKVVNLFPFDYDAAIMYAWTNYKLGKLREAKVLFQKCLMMSPGDSSAQEGLGLIK